MDGHPDYRSIAETPMLIFLSYGLILIFFSFASFYYFNRKNRIKRENHQQRLREKQEELLNILRIEEEKNKRENGKEDNVNDK